MARWLSFFAEYNFRVEYKPGRLNVIADALSRRPDYDPKGVVDEASVRAMHSTAPSSSLVSQVAAAYADDPDTSALVAFLSDKDGEKRQLPAHLRARVHRYRLHESALLYSTDGDDTQRIVVPNDEDLKMQILFEYHDAPAAGHLGREKTFVSLSRDFYWPEQYKWVRKYVRACEVCQRSKPALSSQALLQPLPVPSECWKSVSLDFVFGLPPDSGRRTGVLVFVGRFSKMVHLAAVSGHVTAAQAARVFVGTVFRLHGMPEELISDRDPRFTARFWQETFALTGAKLSMSTSDHPETDGQTGCVNRTLGGIIRSCVHAFPNWSDCLLFAEFAVNNSVHVSTGHTPFYANYLRHHRTPPIVTGSPVSTTKWSRKQPLTTRRTVRESVSTALTAQAASEPDSQGNASSSKDEAVDKFVLQRQAAVRYVRDSVADAADSQKQKADAKGRKNFSAFKFPITEQQSCCRNSLGRSRSNV